MNIESLLTSPQPISALQNETLPARPYRLADDITLPYATGYRAGACHLRVFVPVAHPISTNHPVIVLVTEQPERAGLSVTNGIEVIASTVCQRYDLHPRHTVLIEHYDDRERGSAAYLPGRVDGEKFSCIVFDDMQIPDGHSQALRLQRPQWRTLAKAEVEALIGAPLL